MVKENRQDALALRPPITKVTGVQGHSMKSVFALSMLAVTVLSEAAALAPSPLWTRPTLSNAKYLITEAKVYGSPQTVSSEQVQSVLRAMKTDAAGAIKRRYPQAQWANESNNAIVVTPVLSVPNGLWPWSSVEVKMLFQLPDGQQMNVGSQFGVMELWNQGYNAANYAFDQLTKRLP